MQTEDCDQATAPIDFLPSWYRAQQAAHSMLEYDDDHPLRDASLEMLGMALIGLVAVLGIGGALLLGWWLA